jgi:hypothetical protein
MQFGNAMIENLQKNIPPNSKAPAISGGFALQPTLKLT